MQTKKGALAVLFCYILWGVLPVFWKLLSAVPPLYVLFSRCVWTLLFLIPVVLLTGKWKKIRAACKNRKTLLLTVLAGVCVCVNWGIYVYAVSSGHIVESSLGYYINPLVMVLIGVVFFREKLGKAELAAVLLALAAILFFAFSQHVVPWISLLIAFSFGIYGGLKKKAGLESDISLCVETAALFLPALLYLLLAEQSGHGAAGVLTGWQWLLLPLTGIVTGVPLLLFGSGVRRLDYSLCGMLMYINPTLQLLVGVALYHEAFTTAHLVTFLLIWSSVILYLIGIRRKNAKK